MAEVGGDIRLTIASNDLDFSDVKLGDSIVCNGICLTVIELLDNSHAVDVSRETLAKTTMQYWQTGDVLNLEKAMLPTTRFGYHMVSGHVDGVGEIIVINEDARSIYFEVKVPTELKKYVATKGSITLDGISLTTNLVKDEIVCLKMTFRIPVRSLISPNIGSWAQRLMLRWIYCPLFRVITIS